VRLKRRRSRFPSIDWRSAIDSSEPLKGQLWTRSERALKEPDVHWSRRAIASAVAVLECALLAWLLFGPVFAVRAVHVTGAQHMSPAQVAAVAGLAANGSVLTVDGLSDQQKLLGQTWIRAASVQPELDGTVDVVISEWQPVAAYHAGANGKMFLLSDQAVVLGPAVSLGALTNVQGPAVGDPKTGDRVLDPELLVALVNIQRLLPGLIGQQVKTFIVDSCGNLTMVSVRGWKVYFGRVLTPEEFASLRDKVAALKAIAGKVNYNSTDLDYVNVMNPTEPAAAFKSKEPAPPSPSPGSPSPPPSPSPSPGPVCK
jgi:POTRA domain-containing FtsQ-type protein